MSNEIKQYLKEWCELPTNTVLERFASLPNSLVIGEGDECSVFVPGTRKDRVLLVAHSDTVFDRRQKNIKVKIDGDVLSSAENGIGIGADDRAGCAILWELRNSGHSLFVPNGEEIGCRGSGFAMNEIPDLLQDHQFAIEFDRMHDKDLVYYRKGTKSFSAYMEEQMDGYKFAHGAWTDICTICRDICGVNISVGYYGQHTSRERLVVSEWINTLNQVKKLLENKEIPKFPLVESPVKVISDIHFTVKDFEKFIPKKPKPVASTHHNSPHIIQELPFYGQNANQDMIGLKDDEYEVADPCEMIVESMMEEGSCL